MIMNHPIRRSLSVAAIYLLTAVVLNALRLRQLVSGETAVRLMGMLMGSVVMVTANAIPKRLVLWRVWPANRHASKPCVASPPGRWCRAAWLIRSRTRSPDRDRQHAGHLPAGAGRHRGRKHHGTLRLGAPQRQARRRLTPTVT